MLEDESQSLAVYPADGWPTLLVNGLGLDRVASSVVFSAGHTVGKAPALAARYQPGGNSMERGRSSSDDQLNFISLPADVVETSRENRESAFNKRSATPPESTPGVLTRWFEA